MRYASSSTRQSWFLRFCGHLAWFDCNKATEPQSICPGQSGAIDTLKRMRRIPVSAGEASGDLYASLVVEEFRRALPGGILRLHGPPSEGRGCAHRGRRLESGGRRPRRSHRSHSPDLRRIPQISGRRIRRHPDLAILTDSPDFHLRVARKLHRQGIPGGYLVAPQVWAWRKGRVKRNAPRPSAACSASSPSKRSFSPVTGSRPPISAILWPGWLTPCSRRDEFFRKHRLAARASLSFGTTW